MRGLSGLAVLNVELSSRCNKDCWICGRRKIDREHPEISMNYGNMDFKLVESISSQLPPNIIVQLHNNGEPLLYPEFGRAVKLFDKQITSIDTNGKLLLEKFDEIVDNLDTLAISIFEKDKEADEQYKIMERFLELKGDKKPYTIFRINGKVNKSRYKKLSTLIASRILHSPMGSFDYKNPPTIPEIGICLDFLHHMSIDRKGEVSICVRFDPSRLGVIGDANKKTLNDIWNSKKRMKWMECHKQGRRDMVPLCSYCEFWGIPTGGSLC